MANVKISPRRGGWGNRVSPYLSGRGPEARAPRPPPAGGCGRAKPSQEQPFFVPSGCGASRMDGYREHRLSKRGVGNPGFPTPPPRREMGTPGFPMPPPAGGCGRAQPSQEQPYVHCGVVRRSRMDGYREHRLSKRVWGNRVFPRPRPAGAWGHRVSPCPHPREGLGGRSPPRNNRMCIAALCGGAAWTAEVNTVRRVLPPSQPPPAGGRSRVPAPSGGGGGSRHRARGAAPRAGRPRSRAGCIGRGAPCA